MKLNQNQNQVTMKARQNRAGVVYAIKLEFLNTEMLRPYLVYRFRKKQVINFHDILSFSFISNIKSRVYILGKAQKNVNGSVTGMIEAVVRKRDVKEGTPHFKLVFSNTSKVDYVICSLMMSRDKKNPYEVSFIARIFAMR